MIYICFCILSIISSNLSLYAYYDNDFNATNSSNSSNIIFTNYQSNYTLISLDISIFIFCSGFLINEIYEATKYKKCSSYFSNIWNIIDVLQLILIITLIPLKIIHSDIQFMILSCFSILLWIKFLYFARGFKKFGPFVNITIKMLKSTVNFLIMCSFIYFGFSQAFFILLGPYSYGYENIMNSLVSVFIIILGEFDMDVLYQSKFPVLSIIMFMIYSTIMTIIILNFLIAILSDVYSSMIIDSDKKWRIERAHLIISLQKSTCTSKCSKKQILNNNINKINFLWIIANENTINKKLLDKLPFKNIKNTINKKYLKNI